MGHAFASNTKFESRGFKLIGIFDADPKKVGMEVKGQAIRDYHTVGEFIEKNRPDMAILTVPKSAMHSVAQDLIGYGIKAFLNFSHTELAVSEGITVENIHLGDSLMRLSYKIQEQGKQT